jgi:glycosyltransferase involved in cell wall biosynthesis
MRPRVLRVITRLNIGGPATHVLVADEGLAELGWETLLVHGSVEPDEVEMTLDGAPINRIRLPSIVRPIRPGPDAAAMAGLIRIIRRFRPHIIHTHLSKAGLLGRSAGMLASRAARIHTFHGTVFSGYFGSRSSAAIIRIERFLGHRSAALIALSEGQRLDLLDQRLAPADRIRIVPLGLRLERFRHPDRSASRRALGIPPDRPSVVAIGRQVPIKRIDRLIEAFRTVRGSGIDAHLYLVGDGQERPRLEAFVRDADLEASVTFAGWSRRGEEWIAAADVVALSSDSEGTPLALIEAATAGRPVVATDVGGVRDIVRDGVTGFVVQREDVGAMAASLARILRDDDLRHRMGDAAAGTADLYSADRLVGDLDALYREVLAARGVPGP